MKSIIRITALCLVFGVVAVSCSSSKPKKTIENLKAAITGESNASATYLAFSKKAAEDGYPNISKMFAAASAAEAIHVRNHNEVLVKLGEPAFTAKIETPVLSGMANNLQAAIDGETYEFTEMYPGFIISAMFEKCFDAITSFSWASDAEATHARLYTKVLNILQATGSDNTASSVWHICPKCGDLYDDMDGVDGCSICATSSALFIRFD